MYRLQHNAGGRALDPCYLALGPSTILPGGALELLMSVELSKAQYRPQFLRRECSLGMLSVFYMVTVLAVC